MCGIVGLIHLDGASNVGGEMTAIASVSEASRT